MDHRSEIRDFLTTRRAKITPDRAGLPVYGGNRRVTGLRREEVALLAGVSVDYYTRLERGNLNGVSESVLEALARMPARRVRPPVQRILDAMTGAPAWVRNARMTTWLITGCSTGLGRALAEAVLARGDNAIVTPPPSPPWKACPDHSARNWSRWASP